MIIVLSAITSTLFSQNETTSFHRLTNKNGLSQNTVNAIVQDDKGLLWLGTQDGLNVFDGISFRVFHGATADLEDNYISCLYVDNRNHLWVGTPLSVTDYNLLEGTSTSYRLNDPSHKLTGTSVVFIMGSPSDEVLVGTDSAVFAFRPNEQGFVKASIVNVVSGTITKLLFHLDKIWIGTENGLYLEESGTVRSVFEGNPNDGLPANRINDLMMDNRDNLWAATDYGLVFVDVRMALSVVEKGRFNSVIQDANGIVWAGAGSGIASASGKSGLFRINIDGRADRFEHNSNHPSSLSDDNIQVIFEDQSGGIWIGTFLQGVNYLEQRRFQSGCFSSDLYGTNGSNVVRSILAVDNKVYIGTIGSGMAILDLTNGAAEPIPNATYENPKVIFLDSKKRFWIGTDVGLLLVTRDFHSPKIILARNPVRCIAEDRSGLIWFGTSSGLYVLNDELVPLKFEALFSPYVTSILFDKKNEMWIGTLSDGLWRVSETKSSIKNYRSENGTVRGPSSNRILSLEEDPSGNLWVGTFGGGLNRFDKQAEQFVFYTTDNGLPNNVICAMKSDSKGQLWISTNRGISVYRPETGRFVNFDQHDGLQSNEFNDAAAYKDSEGRMYFGGVNGFNVFHPDSIKDNTHIPPVVLTSFKKFNREFDLSPPIEARKELKLTYEDYVISFEFAALDYTNPEKNKYAYKLDGFDKDWTYTDSKHRFATYTNLDPGDYVLRVKGSNNDGYWNDEGVSLKITVTPPFWATWWFRTALVGFVVASAIGGYRLRVQTIQKRNRWLESEVTKRTSDLNKALDDLKEAQVKLVHSEKMASLGTMVGGLSHEMNNSLGFVVSNLEFLKETMPKLVAMVETYDNWMTSHEQPTLRQEIADLQEGIEMSLLKEDTNKAVRIASEGTKRITRIIENLRRFALIQGGSWGEVEVESHLKFVAELFFGGDIDIKISIEAEPGLKLHCMVGEFNVALMNILDNAVRAIRDAEKAGKLQKGGGHITLEGRRSSSTEIRVSISDNGIGIPAENLIKVFDPFFTTRGVGFGKGMGLAEVYGVMKNHKGSAEAERAGDGTVIRLKFPIS